MLLQPPAVMCAQSHCGVEADPVDGSTCCPARGLGAMREGMAAACSGRDSSPWVPASVSYVCPFSSTRAPRRVSSFNSRMMTACGRRAGSRHVKSAEAVGPTPISQQEVPRPPRQTYPRHWLPIKVAFEAAVQTGHPLLNCLSLRRFTKKLLIRRLVGVARWHDHSTPGQAAELAAAAPAGTADAPATIGRLFALRQASVAVRVGGTIVGTV